MFVPAGQGKQALPIAGLQSEQKLVYPQGQEPKKPVQRRSERIAAARASNEEYYISEAARGIGQKKECKTAACRSRKQQNQGYIELAGGGDTAPSSAAPAVDPAPSEKARKLSELGVPCVGCTKEEQEVRQRLYIKHLESLGWTHEDEEGSADRKSPNQAMGKGVKPKTPLKVKIVNAVADGIMLILLLGVILIAFKPHALFSAVPSDWEPRLRVGLSTWLITLTAGLTVALTADLAGWIFKKRAAVKCRAVHSCGIMLVAAAMCYPLFLMTLDWPLEPLFPMKSTDDSSESWLFMQDYLQCCGGRNYTLEHAMNTTEDVKPCQQYAKECSKIIRDQLSKLPGVVWIIALAILGMANICNFIIKKGSLTGGVWTYRP